MDMKHASEKSGQRGRSKAFGMGQAWKRAAVAISIALVALTAAVAPASGQQAARPEVEAQFSSQQYRAAERGQTANIAMPPWDTGHLKGVHEAGLGLGAAPRGDGQRCPNPRC